ncbi:hypothetical protein Q4485_09400 [Granulosicoccaceae sp. 1_MG-2023]|nr:hypothetical protein [Granulosicoccaceae sp. 1_MG-2023]
MSTYTTPKKSDVQSMLGMLYEGLEVEEASPIDPAANNETIVGIFVDDDDKPVTACICDYPFAGYAGSALTKIPKAGADEQVASGEFSQMILGNLYEVMNICSRLFMNSNTPHLRLGKTYRYSELPPEMAELLPAAANQAGFEVEVDGYGKGVLSFHAT